MLLTEAADQQRLTSFRIDAAAAANIHHRNIAAIYELGEHVKQPFIAMQRLEGEDLSQVIAKRASLTLLQKMLLMFEVADALKAAHRGGIHHVGIRPASIILLEDGSAKIAEFGSVRFVRPLGNGSGQDSSLLYVSPEELSSPASPDALSDIFVYGILYYELLTGKHPFATGDPGGTTFKILHENPPLLRTLAPDCPEVLEQVVHRALEKDRDLRYQDLDDAQCDAEPILQELKRERAAALLIDGIRLMGEGQLDQAQTVVREALELDPSNREARRLRDTIRDQVQRRIIRSRLDALLTRADDETAGRRFAEAVQTLESGLHLDPADGAIQSRLNQARLLMERAQRAAALLIEARWLLDGGNLAEARRKASEALEEDPEIDEGRPLLATIQEAIERREQKNRFLEKVCSEALVLCQKQDFAAAIRVLEQAVASFPEEAALERALAEALAVAAAYDREQAIAKLLEQCARYRQEHRLEEAIESVNSCLATYPDDAALFELRGQLEKEQKERQRAAAVRQAIQEAQWLMDQNRPDLAVQLLRENSAAYPEETELAGRLALAERSLADWERRRFVDETLLRVSTLEHRQQWRTALTVLQEALQAHPDAVELDEVRERLQRQIDESERQRKLARRLEIVRQKIVEQAWPQALSLIEAAQKDFPGELELEQLLAQARAGQQCADCENVIAEIEQCLADGELQQAEEMFRKAELICYGAGGAVCYPGETRFQALREGLERERTFQDQWREAEVLFGRSQFQAAEKILLKLVASKPNNSEVPALLEAVRSGRAAAEEKQFYDRGRVKALRLMEEQQFDQAVDLLRNLLSLFPSDAILERDLQSAITALGQTRESSALRGTPVRARLAGDAGNLEHELCVETSEAYSDERKDLPSWAVAGALASPGSEFSTRQEAGQGADCGPGGPPHQAPAVKLEPVAVASWRRPAVLTLGVFFLAASAAVPLWRFSRKQDSVALASPAPEPAKLTAPEVAKPHSAPSPAAAAEPAAPPTVAPKKIPDQAAKKAVPTARRILDAFTGWRASAPARPSLAVAPPPIGIEQSPAGVPAALPGAIVAPASPAVAPPPVVVHDPGPPAAKPERIRVGGEFRDAQLLSGPNPVVPPLARERRIYGAVKLEATISKEGTVTNVVVLSGHAMLVEAARQTILARHYRPASLNGEPVEVKMPIQVVFEPGR